MNLKKTMPMFVLLLLATTTANADWSATAKVREINIGGNGSYGTFVSLTNFSFTGCSVTTVGFIDGNGVNYKMFMASLLAAKMAEKDVKLEYSGCSGGYPIVREVYLP
jgi:hypothetical protein